MLLDVINLQRIRQSYGDAMAEQCLLRAVIKLHRVVRDSDPAGRIDAGRFGLILEGVRSREDLQERMVRLVTAGLTPSRGAKLDIPLQFHVACVLLSERVMTAPLILRDLDRLLASMSPRTRRPIRFLEPDGRQARPGTAPVDPDALADCEAARQHRLLPQHCGQAGRTPVRRVAWPDLCNGLVQSVDLAISSSSQDWAGPGPIIWLCPFTFHRSCSCPSRAGAFCPVFPGSPWRWPLSSHSASPAPRPARRSS